MDEVLTHARSGLETTTDEMEIAEMRKISENKCTTAATSKPQDPSAKRNLHENGDGRYHGERFMCGLMRVTRKEIEVPRCGSFEPRRYTGKLRGHPLRSDSWFASFSAETERSRLSSRYGQQQDWMNDAQVAQ
jgi:hypothetical protein